jgi:hypothetical protein
MDWRNKKGIKPSFSLKNSNPVLCGLSILRLEVSFAFIIIHYVLCIHDLFGTELAMIFSFHVGLTDSVMQRMQFFFLSVSVRHFLATALPDLLF